MCESGLAVLAPLKRLTKGENGVLIYTSCVLATQTSVADCPYSSVGRAIVDLRPRFGDFILCGKKKMTSIPVSSGDEKNEIVLVSTLMGHNN